MTEPAGGENLTGVWQGLYSYSYGQSVSFVATLIDSGASFSGTIHEPSIFGGDTINATFAGARQGNAVSFLKTYEKSAGPQYASSVQYEGALNGDATEIEGRWTIRVFGMSGKFLMIRSAGKAAEVEQKVSEQV
jgi:hypothetical protein